MISTQIFIMTIAVVIAAAALVAWLLRKNALDAKKQLLNSNQELKQQLQDADDKAQMLTGENANLKAQHAAASETARMLKERVDELNTSVTNLKDEIKQLDDVKTHSTAIRPHSKLALMP